MDEWIDEWMRGKEHKKDPGDRKALLDFPLQHSCSLQVTIDGPNRCLEFLQL